MSDSAPNRPGFAGGVVRRLLQRREANAAAALDAAPPSATAALREAVSARRLRLFVSSTFEDMQAERDELLLKVFARFERACRARDVQFLPIDLRWGVTQEESERGEILRICFDQVDRSRPFFLGLIGERVGWAPGAEALSANLGPDHAWALAHPEASVTELEFRRGLEGLAAAPDTALFYAKALAPGAVVEDAPRLEALRALVAERGAPFRDGYGSVEELGRWVYEDLCALLDRHFPQTAPAAAGTDSLGETPRFLERATAHFTGRVETLRRLDAHQDGGLALIGPVGAGKTAALAAWRRSLGAGASDAHTPETDTPNAASAAFEATVSAYFASASREPGWAQAARRFLSDLGAQGASAPVVLLHVADAERHGYIVRHEAPDGASEEIEAILRSPTSLADAMAEAIAHKAGTTDRLTLLIDGLDEMAGADPEAAVAWLPMTLPSGVRMVASAADPAVAEALRRRGWTLAQLPALDPPSRRALIASVLGAYGKALDPASAERLATDPKSGNPLFLRTVLEELRVFGRREALDARLDDYLASADIEDLFDRVFARWERVFETETAGETDDAATGVVGDFLGLVAIARRGVLEADLMALLAQKTGARRTVLAPLAAVATAMLQERDGRLIPGEGPMRRVIERRYLGDDARRRALHAAIAQRLFATIYPQTPTAEIITIDADDLEDLRWHLREAALWERLAFSLSVGGLFATQTQRDLDRFIAHWRVLGAHIDIAETYRPLLDAPERFFGAGQAEIGLNNLAFLLMNLGRADLSEDPFRQILRKRLERVAADTPLGAHLITSAQGNLAGALEAQGRLAEAAACFGSALSRAEAAEAIGDQAVFLSHLARVADKQDDADGQRRALQRILALSDAHETVPSYDAASRLGALMLRLGRADAAAAYLRRGYAEIAAEQGPLHPDTATAAIDLALALAKSAAWDAADGVLDEAEAIVAALPAPSPRHRIAPLHARALVHAAAGRSEQADAAHRAALALVEPMDAPAFALLGDVLLDAATFWEERGEAALARRALERLLSWPLTEEAAAAATCRLGAALLQLGDRAAAQARLEACVALEQKRGRLVSPLLRRALALMAEAADQDGDAARAQTLRDRIETVEARAQSWRLQNEGDARLRAGDPAGAAERLRAAFEIKRRVLGPDDPDTALSQRVLGDAIAAQGRPDQALALLTGAIEVLDRAYPDGHAQLEAAASSIAHASENAGRPADAEAAYRRAAREAARAFGDPSRELARSLRELADFLGDQNRPDDALEAFEGAHDALAPLTGPLSAELLDLLIRRGRTYFHRERYAAAAEDFQRAVQIRETALGPAHPDVAASLNELGFARHAEGRGEDAEAAFRSAIDRLGPDGGAAWAVLSTAYASLATLLEQRGDHVDAAAPRRRVLTLTAGALGPDAAETETAAQSLRETLARGGVSAEEVERAVARLLAETQA